MTARKQKGIGAVVHADGTYTVHLRLVWNGQWGHTLCGTDVEMRLHITDMQPKKPSSSHHAMRPTHGKESCISF